MTASDASDPFNSYHMRDLLSIDESQWRQYVMHQNWRIGNDLREIKKMLKRRPEVVRANIALALSLVAGVCTIIMTVAALMRGG